MFAEFIMGRARDKKVRVLPSTTRKGTTLSTSAALDSPSVLSQLITPPHVTRTVISAEFENTSDNLMMLLLCLMRVVH